MPSEKNIFCDDPVSGILPLDSGHFISVVFLHMAVASGSKCGTNGSIAVSTAT